MKRKVLIGLIGFSALCVVLFVPLPENRGDRLLVYLQDLAHFPVSALMAWILLWLAGTAKIAPRARGGAAVLVTLAVGLAAEFLQPFVGRTAGVRDVVLGLAGSVSAVCVYLASGTAVRRTRALLVTAVVLLTTAAVCPVVLILADRATARRDFPLLASFESRAELGRWSVRGCRVSRVSEHATDGKLALKIEVENPDNYPGLFECDATLNMRDINELCFDVFVPGGESVPLWFRADDRVNAAYADRFQDLRTLLPGTNTVCIGREDLQTTPSGRPLELGRVLSWGIFFDRPRPGQTVYLDNVRALVK